MPGGRSQHEYKSGNSNTFTVRVPDTFTISSNKNWSNAGVTGANGSPWPPLMGDTVIINSGITLTVDVTNAVAGAVTFGNSLSTTAILTVNTGSTLTIGGALTLRNAASTNTNAALSGGGTINCASIQVGGTDAPGTTSSYVAKATLTSTVANLSVSGNLAVTGAHQGGSRYSYSYFNLESGYVTVGSVIFNNYSGESNGNEYLQMNTGAEIGTLVISGSTPFTNNDNGTFSPNGTSATVNYNGGAQTIAAVTYNNLIFSGIGSKTMNSSSISIVGRLTIAPSGSSAKAKVNNGLNLSVYYLTLGSSSQSPDTYGATTSGAHTKNDTYFDNTATGILTVSH